MEGMGLGAWRNFALWLDLKTSNLAIRCPNVPPSMLLTMEELVETLSAEPRRGKTCQCLPNPRPTGLYRDFEEVQVYVERLEGTHALKNSVYPAWLAGHRSIQHRVAYPKDGLAGVRNVGGRQTRIDAVTPLTQIEPYDIWPRCDALRRFHTVLIDFAATFGRTVSMDYFKQKIKEEVDLRPPHKVNPSTSKTVRETSAWPMPCWDTLPKNCPSRGCSAT